MTNAELWGLSKYIKEDLPTDNESKEFYEALDRAYEAFRSQGSKTHQSVLDFAEWFFSSPETSKI